MKYEIKPTSGNINLMISINEIEDLLRMMMEFNVSKMRILLTKIGDYSYKKHFGFEEQSDQAIIWEEDLLNGLHAPLGLYHARRDGIISNDSPFRIELKKDVNGFWTWDNGDSK